MGAFLDKPKVEKESNGGEGNGLRFGVSSMQGWRVEMEDAHTSLLSLNNQNFFIPTPPNATVDAPGSLHNKNGGKNSRRKSDQSSQPKLASETLRPEILKDWSLFAVFDGHAGRHTSAYSSKHLVNYLLTTDKFKELLHRLSSAGSAKSDSMADTMNDSDRTFNASAPKSSSLQCVDDRVAAPTATMTSGDSSTSVGRASQLDSSSFIGSTGDYRQVSMETTSKETISDADIEDCVRKAFVQSFLSLDEQMRKLSDASTYMPSSVSGTGSSDRFDRSGTTAVCALISPRHVYIANCGDSRAIAVTKGGKLRVVTKDHKPVNPEEKERILNAGGSVMIQRVNGSLAVSRALGDFEYKRVEGKGPCEQLVSPEPDIYVIDRSQDILEFIVLACDGVWDVMTNDDVTEYVHYLLSVERDLKVVCERLIDTCLHKGSRDNISVNLITFPDAPAFDDHATELDSVLNEYLRKKTKEFIETFGQDEPCDIDSVFHQIEQRWNRMDDAPPLPPGGGLPSKRYVIEQTFRQLKPKSSHENEDDDDDLDGGLDDVNELSSLGLHLPYRAINPAAFLARVANDGAGSRSVAEPRRPTAYHHQQQESLNPVIGVGLSQQHDREIMDTDDSDFKESLAGDDHIDDFPRISAWGDYHTSGSHRSYSAVAAVSSKKGASKPKIASAAVDGCSIYPKETFVASSIPLEQQSSRYDYDDNTNDAGKVNVNASADRIGCLTQNSASRSSLTSNTEVACTEDVTEGGNGGSCESNNTTKADVPTAETLHQSSSTSKASPELDVVM